MLQSDDGTREREAMSKRKPHWSDALVKLGACAQAVRYARRFKTFREAWEKCDNYHWMAWLCSTMRSVDGWPMSILFPYLHSSSADEFRSKIKPGRLPR